MLCTIGSGIRCITMDEYYFTICAHIGAFMNAIAGVIFGPSVVLLSSTWFPPDQRASATGAGTAVSALGMAASYLLGPLVITLPVPDFPDKTECYRIRQEILKLLFLDFMAHFFLVWVVIFMFPSTPPTPPSRSSSISLGYKRNFGKSINKLVRNKNIWLLGLSAALCSGMTGPWLSQLTILFSHKYLSAVETAKLGFWTIISSCLFSLTATRFSDLFQGHIKAIITGLLTYATAMFIWIFSIINISTTFHKHHLIFAVIGGFSASWGASPLFYELGAEIGYPVPEGLVAGYIMSMSSLSCVIVYGMFYVFSDTGMIWLNYGLVTYNVAALIVLYCVDDQYHRLTMDEKR